MRLVEDIICIILLVILPDYFLERLGLYDSMRAIIYRRANDGKND